MPQFVHNRTGRIIDVSEGIASRYRNTTRWTETGTAPGGTVEVPDGTVAEILEWAGTDPTRQAQALASEKAGKNRKGILEAFG